MWRRVVFSLAAAAILAPSAAARDIDSPEGAARNLAVSTKDAKLRCEIDARSGLPRQIKSVSSGRSWLAGPVTIRVRNETTGTESGPVCRDIRRANGEITATQSLNALALKVVQRWFAAGNGLVWNLAFDGSGPRAGHEVVVNWPILAPDSRSSRPASAASSTWRPARRASPRPTRPRATTAGGPTCCRWQA